MVAQEIMTYSSECVLQVYENVYVSVDVLHVLNREARARKFAFQVLSTSCKYHLATESAEEREKWVKGLEALLFGPPQPGIVCKLEGGCCMYVYIIHIYTVEPRTLHIADTYY